MATFFDLGSGPLANNASKAASDFAIKAVANLMPWIKEHYQLATIEPGFTPGDLYNYHLRGDYYLGLTKDGGPLEQVGLAGPAGTAPSLVHIAQQTGYSFPPANTSAATAGTIAGLRSRPLGNYGIRFAEASIPPAQDPMHFFTREVASGASLSEFLFPELGTMFYRLLPYVKDFQQGVSKFLVEESLGFIKNSKHLANGTNHVHNAVRIDQAYIDAQMSWAYSMGITPADVGNASLDLMTMATPGTPTYQELTCLLPLHYARQVHQEVYDLIEPDMEPLALNALRTRIRDLTIAALEACIEISDRGGIGSRGLGAFRRIDTSNYNQDPTKKALTAFFDSYFLQIHPSFPVGSVVELNISDNSIGGRSPILAAMAPLTTESAAQLTTHTAANRLFRVTAVEIRKKKNKPTVTHYALMSVDEFNAPLIGPLGVPIQTRIRRPVLVPKSPGGGLIEVYKGDYADYLGFTAYGSTGHYPGTYDYNNIIGRCLLSTCYDIFSAGNYYSTERDMRVLNKGQPPGHYPPIIEALTGAIEGRRPHQPTNNKGVIDSYAEIRGDLMAIYLATMYDNIKGPYRDQFVAFYTGDFNLNELDYYTSAVSNYVSSTVAPEDHLRQPVLVGPRLTTRVPVDEFGTATSPVLPIGAERREFTFTRSADPEVVFYQIDSPLLREAYRQLNSAFYTWYTELAQELDSGQRNITPGGNEPGEALPGASASTKSKKADKSLLSIIRPTKLILAQMWPLITQRAQSAVESGEVPAHTMLIQIATAVRNHRTNTSQAVPLVPVGISFINFGELLRDPAQYSLPPNTSSADVTGFIGYIEATYYNDYRLLASLASNIETSRSINYTQDQLISAFKATYSTFRNTKALNRFSFPASAQTVRIFREIASISATQRAVIASTLSSTMAPPAPDETLATAPPVPLPVRRLP